MGPRFGMLAAALLAALLIPIGTASARLADYRFSSRSGSYSSIGGTQWISASYSSYGSDGYYGNAAVRGPLSIGFTFRFDCTDYTTFGINVNGNMVLGAGGLNQPYNNLDGSARYPIIAPFWDQQWLYGYCGTNHVRSQTSGSVGSRVLTVQWSTQYYGWCGAYYTYQVKLYEGSNKIEFHYGTLYQWLSTSASIGIAASSTDYLSITPGTGASSTSSNDNFNNYTGVITSGTIYTFDPSAVAVSGRTGAGDGGTVSALNGDTFFTGLSDQLGNRSTYSPLSLQGFSCAANVRHTMRITGPAALDYSFATSGTQVSTFTVSGSSPTVPQIHFTPRLVGEREATMSMRNEVTGEERTFTLEATGTPRTAITGNPGSGGVSPLADGATLLGSTLIPRLASVTQEPITVANTNLAPTFNAAPVTVTATIDSLDAVSDQYKLINPATGLPVESVSTTIGPGETYTPEIVFTALSAGVQEADLSITTSDGDTMTFALAAVSNAPGGTFTVNDGEWLQASFQFSKQTTCVGDQTLTVPLQIHSTGVGPLMVNDFSFFGVDTTVRQGVPAYPMYRDARGRLIPTRDYYVSATPGGPRIAFPIVVPQGETNTYYLTFVGQMPGRRWARGFVHSNAENFSGVDTNFSDGVTTAPVTNLGVLSFDALAASHGSKLVTGAAGLELKPIVFPHTRVGESSEVSFTIANSGGCDLRINRTKLRLSSGDVNEFSILSALRNASFDQVTGDYLLAPGAVDTITARFTPSRPGTRMATLWLQTNDSALVRDGLSERGSHYLDLSGRGLAGLDAHELVLDPVVIGGSVDGVATLENSLNVAVSIASVEFIGDNATEFSESPTAAWPARPFTVLAGEKLRLGVRLTPIGEAGLRRTTLVLVTTGGDTITVPVRGEAGTQTLVVSATSLFEDVSVQVGSAVHRSVTISNAGTLPLRIASLAIVGIDSLSYRLGMMPRMDLEPGQAEFLEVTYAPTASGQTSAQLVITASNGQTSSVALGGTALKIRRDPVDPVSTSTPANQEAPEWERSGRPALR